MDKTIFPAWGRAFPQKKISFFETPGCRSSGPENGVPTHFNPCVFPSYNGRRDTVICTKVHLQDIYHVYPRPARDNFRMQYVMAGCNIFSLMERSVIMPPPLG